MITVQDVRFTEEQHIRVNGTDYDFDNGDVVTFSHSYAQKLQAIGHVEQVSDPYDVESDTELPQRVDEDDVETETFDPADHTVPEVEDHVGTVEDLDEIERIRDAEDHGDGRKGVYDALDDREDELTEDEPDEDDE